MSDNLQDKSEEINDAAIQDAGEKEYLENEVPSIFRGLNPAFYKQMSDFFKKIKSGFGRVKKSVPDMSGVSETLSNIGQSKTSTNQEPQMTNSDMQDIAYQSSEPVLNSKKPKKIIKVIVIVAAIFVLTLVGIYAFKSLKNGEPINPSEIFNGKATPTPFEEVEPEKESIYSKDEAILELEKDIRALDAEMRRTVLKESTLGPPTLNFNISF